MCLQSSPQGTPLGGKGPVARTTVHHLCPETKKQPGEPRTACSSPANVTGTSWQLALREPRPDCGAWPPQTRPFRAGVTGGQLRPGGGVAPRPMSFRYLLIRKPARSACRTSQKGRGASGSELDGPPGPRGQRPHGGLPTEGILSPDFSGTHWPGRRWPRGQRVLTCLPSPKPATASQAAADSWCHVGGAQDRPGPACSKTPASCGGPAGGDKALPFGRRATLVRLPRWWDLQPREDSGRPVIAGGGLPGETYRPRR